MDATASSFSTRSNAKRAAEQMIAKGTAPTALNPATGGHRPEQSGVFGSSCPRGRDPFPTCRPPSGATARPSTGSVLRPSHWFVGRTRLGKGSGWYRVRLDDRASY